MVPWSVMIFYLRMHPVLKLVHWDLPWLIGICGVRVVRSATQTPHTYPSRANS